MSCGEERRLFLQAYLDGELDLARTLEMEGHLAQCEECTATLAADRALRAALADPSFSYAPPARMEERLRRQLAGATQPVRALWRPGRRWPPPCP